MRVWIAGLFFALPLSASGQTMNYGRHVDGHVWYGWAGDTFLERGVR